MISLQNLLDNEKCDEALRQARWPEGVRCPHGDIQTFIAPGTRVHTDEYAIYNPLKDWGFDHHTVCHSRGEYARDEDGDGFHEVPVNTQEGYWSLLRSWFQRYVVYPGQERYPLRYGAEAVPLAQMAERVMPPKSS